MLIFLGCGTTSSQHLQAWKWASLVFSSFEYPHQEVNLANSRRLGNVRECSCSGSVTAGGTSTTSRGRGRVDLSVCCHLHHVGRPADRRIQTEEARVFFLTPEILVGGLQRLEKTGSLRQSVKFSCSQSGRWGDSFWTASDCSD